MLHVCGGRDIVFGCLLSFLPLEYCLFTVLPTSPPEDNSDSGGFQLSIVIVIVVVVLALIIGLVVFIVCL